MCVRRILVVLAALLLPLPAAAQTVAVASAHPLASAAGKEILDAGGNAVDAAVAVQMVLSVVEPHASGVGGGALALLWDPQKKALRSFDGLASQPAWATASISIEPDGSRLPYEKVSHSGRAVGVPGAVAMLAEMHQREGRLPWAALFAPAIRIADEGFPLPPYLHYALVVTGDRVADPALRAEWFDGEGKPRPVGTRVRNPGHAASLRRLATDGAAALYRGDLAREVAAAVAAHAIPGHLTEADMAAYRPRERDPICAPAFGARVCTMAPPTYGGILLLQLLTYTEQLGIASQPHDGAAAAHLFLEASRLAYADRFLHVGDPDFEQVPTAGLIDAGYMRARAGLVRPDASLGRVAAGEPPGRRADIAPSEPGAEPTTTHFSIVDRDGRVVSLTTTINLFFGSGISVGGFFLNNALTNFSAPMREGKVAVNRMAPGKRPYTSMTPTIVFDAQEQATMAIGSAGGVRIPSYVAQTMLGVMAWNQDLATAMARPHWFNGNGATELEKDTAAIGLTNALTGLGHEVKPERMQSGVAGILRTPRGWVGAADPRRDGAAVTD